MKERPHRARYIKLKTLSVDNTSLCNNEVALLIQINFGRKKYYYE